MPTKWVGALSVAERNSTSPHYIANGERDIHLFILNVRDGHSRLRRRSGQGGEGSFSSRVREKISTPGLTRGEGGSGDIYFFLLSHFPPLRQRSLATSPVPENQFRGESSRVARYRGNSRNVINCRSLSSGPRSSLPPLPFPPPSRPHLSDEVDSSWDIHYSPIYDN